VRSVKEGCLSKLSWFGKRSPQRASTEFVAHYHSERNHQGKANSLLFRSPVRSMPRQSIRCRERLGRPASILLPGRLNTWTIRGHIAGNGSGLGGSCQNGKKLGRPNTTATNAIPRGG